MDSRWMLFIDFCKPCNRTVCFLTGQQASDRISVFYKIAACGCGDTLIAAFGLMQASLGLGGATYAGFWLTAVLSPVLKETYCAVRDECTTANKTTRAVPERGARADVRVGEDIGMGS
jgi:hypothetical protein